MSFRGLGLGALLLGEYLLVSVLVDAQVLLRAPGWWSVLGHSGMIAPLGIVIAAGVMLLGAARLRAAAQQVLPLVRAHSRRWQALALHLAAYLGFVLLTRHLFDEDADLDSAGVWVLPWALSALAWLGSFVLVLLPVQALGPLLRATGEPLAIGVLSGVAAYLAGIGSGTLWKPLGNATVATVSGLLSLSSSEVVFDPHRFEVGIEDFSVIIDQACSGYEGVGLILALVLIYLWIGRKSLRFPQALLLPPMAIAAAFVANVLRITALVLIGARYSEQLALGGFHSKAGWVLFSAIALGVVGLSRRSGFFAHELSAEGAASRPVAAHLVPLLAITATGLVTGLITVDFDVLRVLRVPVGMAALYAYREYYHFKLGFAWRAALVGVAAYVLWILLEPRPDAEAVQAFSAGLDSLSPFGRTSWLVLRVVSAVLLVPVVEELAFRGYLERRIIAERFTEVQPGTFSRLAFLGSALAFGLLHGRWLAGTLTGMMFSLSQRDGRRLESAILAHAVANALIAAEVLLFDHWHLWM